MAIDSDVGTEFANFPARAPEVAQSAAFAEHLACFWIDYLRERGAIKFSFFAETQQIDGARWYIRSQRKNANCSRMCYRRTPLSKTGADVYPPKCGRRVATLQQFSWQLTGTQPIQRASRGQRRRFSAARGRARVRASAERSIADQANFKSQPFPTFSGLEETILEAP